MLVDGAVGSSHAKPQRSRPHGKRMQQDAHLTWLLGGAALPLTLLAQGAGATAANAGRVHHAQTPIGFSAPLMGNQRLICRTAQGSVRLEGKILSREAARFPGRGNGGFAIARGGGVAARWPGG